MALVANKLSVFVVVAFVVVAFRVVKYPRGENKLTKTPRAIVATLANKFVVEAVSAKKFVEVPLVIVAFVASRLSVLVVVAFVVLA